MTTTTAEAPARPTWRTLCGNITRDPELRYSAKGTPWTTAGLAVNRRKRHDDGTWEELPAEFYDLVCFGDMAEHLSECVAKGTRVIASGRIEEDAWTAKDGTERSTVKLVADEVGVSLRFATVTVAKLTRLAPAGTDAEAGYPSGGDAGYDSEPF